MNKACFMLGYPVEFKNLFLVYPPKLKDVIATKDYGVFLKILTLSQEEIEDEYVRNGQDTKDILTPFEYILNGAYNSPQFKIALEKAFLFFTHEPIFILFETKQIIIGDITNVKDVNELRILKEEDYFEFQNLIRSCVGDKEIEPPRPDEDPRVKAIKAKARYRDRIKAKQGKGLKIESIIASISCMQIGLSPLNIGELSYAAIPILMSVYQGKEKYQIDIDSLLAGADSKKIKPEYWIKNLEDK